VFQPFCGLLWYDTRKLRICSARFPFRERTAEWVFLRGNGVLAHLGHVTATSQADTSKNSSATLTVTSALFRAYRESDEFELFRQVGASKCAQASVNITNTGTGSLTEVSDEPWWCSRSVLEPLWNRTRHLPGQPLNQRAESGDTGDVNLTGGGVTKTVTVALTATAAPGAAFGFAVLEEHHGIECRQL
jgi:hypothetical protein